MKVAGDPAGVEFEVDTARLIGSLKSINLSSGYFKYLPPSDRTIFADSFRFRAKRSGMYSPWEVFNITIIDLGPRVVTPAHLDFGSVRVGETKELPLEIENTGDTPTEVMIESNRTWFVPTPSQFSLEANGKKSPVIRFKPSVSGRLLADLTVTSSGSTQLVRLSGDIPQWLEVSPQSLQITPDKNQLREASLFVKNPNKETETVHVDSKNALIHPTSVQLPAGEAVEIKFSVPPVQKEALKGTIVISNSKDFEMSVNWQAKPVPAFLKLAARISPDLKISPSIVRMANLGGVGGTWNFSISPPFLIDNAAEMSARLMQNGTLEIRITEAPARRTLQPASKPTTAGSLKVSGPDGVQELRIENIQAQKNSPQKGPAPKQTPKPLPLPTPVVDTESFSLGPPPTPQITASSTYSSGSTGKPLGTATPPGAAKKQAETGTEERFGSIVDPAISNEIIRQSSVPMISGLQIDNLKPTSATLVIPYPPTDPQNFPLILHGKISLTVEEKVGFDWKVMGIAPPKRINPKALTYEIKGLYPGESNAIRIISQRLPDGSRVVVSQFNVDTPPAKPWMTWPKGILLLCACAAVGRYIYRR
jgi:hypothetical protein